MPDFHKLCLGNHDQESAWKTDVTMLIFFLVWRDTGVSLKGPNFPTPRAAKLGLRLDCSTAVLTTPQKVLSIWRLVELKMLDFSDRTRTDISILTSAFDQPCG